MATKTSEHVRIMRAAAEMSQAKLASRLNVPETQVASWENGKCAISRADLRKVAKVCGCILAPYCKLIGNEFAVNNKAEFSGPILASPDAIFLVAARTRTSAMVSSLTAGLGGGLIAGALTGLFGGGVGGIPCQSEDLAMEDLSQLTRVVTVHLGQLPEEVSEVIGWSDRNCNPPVFVIPLVATAAARYRALRKLPILTDNNEFMWW